MKKQSLPLLSSTPANRFQAVRIAFMAIFLSLTSFSGFSAVTVTPASGGTNICSTTATTPTTLGNIVITEGSTGDFNFGASSLTIAPPPGWEFIVILPSVTASGGDVSVGSVILTTSSLTMNFNASGTSFIDAVTISGLEIVATTSLSSPGYIYASSDFGIAGITTGASGTDFGDLSIFSALVPSVTISASPSATTCAGSPVTFTPTPVNGGSTPTYQWFVNGGFAGAGSFYSTSTLSNGNTVDAIMTAGGGACTSPGTATSNTITMTVNPVPAAVSVSSPGTYCGSTTLVASGGGGGTIYYEGTTSGGTLTSLGGTPQTVTTSGTYYFNSMSAAGCWGTQGSAAVTIDVMPTDNAGTAQSVCAGGTITLAGSIGGSATSATWSAPSGTFSNTSSLTSTYTPSIVSGTVTLTLTSNNPGGLPCSPAVSTVTITVNPVPTAVSVSTPGAYCGSTVLTTSGGTGGTVYFQGTTSGGTSTILGGTPQTITSSGTYYFNSLEGTCWGTQGSAAVTISTPATANAGLPQTVCAGGTVTLAGSIGGSATSSTWSAASGTFSNVSSLTSTYTPSIASGNVTLTLTTNVPGGPCPAAASTVLITVDAIPNTPTVSGAGTFCGTTNLTASLVGPGTIYFQGTTLGGTSTTLGGTPQAISSSGTYYFAAESALGCWSAADGSAVVTINSLPNAYSVTGGGGYCTGGTGADVGLSFSDAGINYQLYRGGVAIAGTTMAGTNAALDFGLQTIAGTYTIVATNPGTGCTRNQTGSAIVSINALPTQYTLIGGGSYCAGGTGANLFLSGSAIGVSYQLMLAGLPTGLPFSGTGSFMTLGSFTSGGTYTMVATNTTTGCTNTMLGSPTITVNPLPTAFSVTGGGIYCMGGLGLAIGLANSTTGVSYQLFRGATSVGSAVAGTTGSAITFGLQTVAGTYTVVATNTSTFCTNTMTGSATIAISALPAAFTVTGGGSYCSGGTGVVVGLSGSAVGFNYQLFVGGTAIGSVQAGTGSALSFGPQTTAGIYTVVSTNTTTLCSATMTGSATITVNALPTLFTVTGGGSYCAGGSGLTVGLSGSQVGVSYQLYNLFAPVGVAMPGSGSALTFGTFTASGFYTVIATNTTTSCTNNMTGGVAITILPLPAAYNVTGGGPYCAGGTGVNVGLSSSDGGINYQLYNGATPVGSPMSGTGTAINFGLQTLAGIYTVVATNASTLCTNNMTGFVVVTINTPPAAFAITGGGAYCAGGAGVDIGLAGSASGVNYQLFNGTTAVGSVMGGTGAALDFGSQTGAGTYTIVATDATTGCTTTMTGSETITINPLPTAYPVIGGGAFCAGGLGLHVGLNNSDIGISYELYLGGVPLGSAVSGIGSALDFGLETAAGTYTVVGTNPITLCTNAMSGSVTITVNPLPNVYTVIGGGSYCVGGSGIDVALNGSDPGVNYQLFVGTTAVGSPFAGTGSLLDFGFQTTVGTYTVVATNATTGCTASMASSASIATNPPPTAYTVSGGGAYCTGGTGVTIILSGSDAGTNYQLYNGTTIVGSSMAGTGSSITFGPETTIGTYTVVATVGTTGCSGTMTGSAVVSISTYPVVAAISGAGSICIGGHETLSDDTTGGVWSSAAPAVATIGSSTGIAGGISAGAANIAYTVTNGSGCSTTVTTNITVTTGPSISPISGYNNVCMGLIIPLTDATTGGVWTSSNPTIATVNTAGMVTGLALGSTTITYTVTGIGGCSSFTATSVAVGDSIPGAALTPASATLCGGNPVTLTIAVASGSGPYVYTWFDAGIVIAGIVTDTYTVTVPGLYSASINNGTCTEVFSGTNVVNPPNPVIFYDTAAGLLFTTNPFVTYQWYANDTLVPGATNNNFTVGPVGSIYTVVVSDVNGCTDTSGPFVYGNDSGLYVPKVMSASDIKIYPNPTTSVLHIDAPNKVFVSIMATDGQMLTERKEAMSINVSELADGIYLIMVYDENNILVKTEKFVKMQ